jgi:hypothetical protein
MLKLASTVGLALTVANLKRRIRNLAVRGILGTVGAVIAVIAICFLLVALHLWLSGVLNPIASAAIIGGVLLAIALLLFFLASRPMREQARGVEQPAAQLGNVLRDGMARLSGGSGRSPLRDPIVLAAALALVSGIFLGWRGARFGKD